MAREIGNVPGDWIFSFQGTTNHDGLEKTEIPYPKNEICPLTRQQKKKKKNGMCQKNNFAFFLILSIMNLTALGEMP